MPSRPAALAGALLPLLAPVIFASVEPSPAQLLQDLRSFANTGTVLHVGAHPDDENTELITYLARGRGFRTAYLSLTRGDGGQNERGKDFDEKLGVLRTQELVAARKIDGGRQFFTRAIDFGYSKSPEETLKFWNRELVLADVVRVYRQFRPDVVVTRFPVPPGSGGHGHHTASGILAVEAFKIAGDPNAYPEQIKEGLQPWQPKRVLWNSFRIGSIGPGSLDGPVHRQDIGSVDPVTGEEFGTIAARSRAQHATQGLAGFINRARTGPNEQAFMLLAGEPVSGSDLMDGIDTSWHRYPGGADLQQLADKLIAEFNQADLTANLPALLAIRRKLPAESDAVLRDKRAQLDRIIAHCAGLRVRATANSSEVVPGEELSVAFGPRAQVAAKWIPRTWDSPIRATPAAEDFARAVSIGPGNSASLAFIGDVPANQPLTHPYWLRADGSAGISRVEDASLIGLPENPPAFPIRHFFLLEDQVIGLEGEAVYETVDAQGRRQPQAIHVVAPVSLSIASEVVVVAPGRSKDLDVEVTAVRERTAGTLRLEAPSGWKISPATQAFSLSKPGDRATFTFALTAPSAAANGARLTASAEVAGRSYSHQRIELRYDHLPVQLLQPPARARLVTVEFGIKAKRIGYLPGAGDAVAEALAQLGAEVRVLAGADLSPDGLAGLDAVVIGVRAFNEREDLKANFPALLAWVEHGGTVVAQYNRPSNNLPPLGPYELSIAGPAPANRVTDETAPVTFLAPDHPALNSPNKIGPADFEGWVQERGAYFPSKWDESKYVALLAMSDPGETQPSSSLLIARHGRGHYVYTSLAFFRQLPAGVPGAYRLLANLVSLGH